MRRRPGAPRPNAEQDPVNLNSRTEEEHEPRSIEPRSVNGSISDATHGNRGIGETDLRLSTEAVALEKLPHDAGRVDFPLRPRVTQAIDANHADFGTLAAPVVAHR